MVLFLTEISIGVSNFVTENWLALISTIIACFALFISYKTYSKQKPELIITVDKCTHNYPKTVDKSKYDDIRFWSKFHIRNIGDRKTKIDNIKLSFEVNGKKYNDVKEINVLSESGDHLGVVFNSPTPSSDRWIEEHDNKDIGADFVSSFEEPEANKIDCVFTICDTHKEYVVKGISEREERPPLHGKPLG